MSIMQMIWNQKNTIIQGLRRDDHTKIQIEMSHWRDDKTWERLAAMTIEFKGVAIDLVVYYVNKTLWFPSRIPRRNQTEYFQ